MCVKRLVVQSWVVAKSKGDFAKILQNDSSGLTGFCAASRLPFCTQACTCLFAMFALQRLLATLAIKEFHCHFEGCNGFGS